MSSVYASLAAAQRISTSPQHPGHRGPSTSLAALLQVDSAASDDERRKLTGLTGSLRYMAPEVALQVPYNHKAWGG